LVSTFNNLLDRIQSAFTLQKNFISNVSHELKNPMTVIVSQIEVALAQESRTNNEYKQTLISVLDDTHELAETTDNLLQLARLSTVEQQRPIFEEIRLDDVLLLARKNLLKIHSEYRITFDIVGVAENETDLCVKGNEMLLRSAFTNIIDNACKYSKDKSAAIKIRLLQEGGKIVEISDRGEGIHENEISTLFQPFYRNPKHKHIKGTGIGLSLVDTILKLHQVPLQIASNNGQGSAFIMHFQN
jgi:signal transduction histidine kinase